MALINCTYFCLFASLSSHFPPDCSKEQTQSWRSYLRFVLWWTWFVIVLCPAMGSGHDTRDAIGLVDLWCWSDASTFGGSICPCLYVAAICVVSWKISFLFVVCVLPPRRETTLLPHSCVWSVRMPLKHTNTSPVLSELYHARLSPILFWLHVVWEQRASLIPHATACGMRAES